MVKTNAWLSVLVAVLCLATATVLLNVSLVSGDYSRVVLGATVLLSAAVAVAAMLAVRARGRWGFVAAVLILVWAAFLAVGNEDRWRFALQTPAAGETYIVEGRVVGWIRVRYGVPGAPRAGLRDHGRVVRVSPSGVVLLADEPIGGGRTDRVLYECDGREEQAVVTVPGMPELNRSSQHYEKCLFVGTDEDLKSLVLRGVPMCQPGLTRR